MRKIVQILAWLAVALVGSGCAYKGPKTDPNGGTTLVNTYWKLVAVDGVDYEPVETKREVHIILRPDNRVTGFSGCNTFSGSWLLEDDQLVFGPLMSTKMACPDLGREQVFMSALDGNVDTEITGELLTIMGSDGTELKFRAIYLK